MWDTFIWYDGEFAFAERCCHWKNAYHVKELLLCLTWEGWGWTSKTWFISSTLKYVYRVSLKGIRLLRNEWTSDFKGKMVGYFDEIWWMIWPSPPNFTRKFNRRICEMTIKNSMPTKVHIIDFLSHSLLDWIFYQIWWLWSTHPRDHLY